MLRHSDRRILRFGVTKRPSAAWAAQQIREAFPYDAAHADAMLLKRGRIRFVKSNGVQSDVLAPFPSAFFGFGRDCAEALRQSSIPGIRVRLNRG